MEAFIGTILPWPMQFEPKGWVFCDGRELPIAGNEVLFSLIGEIYGGNGIYPPKTDPPTPPTPPTKFKIPDLRSRLPLGAGINPTSNKKYTVGEKEGKDKILLTAENLPLDSLAFSVTTDSAIKVKDFSVGIPVSNKPATTPIPSNSTYLAMGKDASGNLAQMYTTIDPDKNTLKPFTVSGVEVEKTFKMHLKIDNSEQVALEREPYLVLNYIICMVGIYPQRS